MKTCIVVMGPSGAGKTTTAVGIAEHLGWPFAEADEFHPRANVEKMRAGTPLTDEDRAPWLATLRDWISERAADGTDTVMTCSALKRRYRDVLRGADARVRFVELAIEKEVVAGRLQRREGHYMPASLLDSQFAAFEPLGEDEDGVRVEVGEADAPAVVRRALDALALVPEVERRA